MNQMRTAQNYQGRSQGDMSQPPPINGMATANSRHLSAIIESISQTVIRCHQIADQISDVLMGPEPATVSNATPPQRCSVISTLAEMDDGVRVLQERLARIAGAVGAV